MNKKIKHIKKKLDESIEQVCNAHWMFCENPNIDFTRNRKLPFKKVISFLLSMEGGSLSSEILKYFRYSRNIATTSALVQQRKKINPDALLTTFSLFARKADFNKTYKGLRLIAADGSDILIPTNPQHLDSFYPETEHKSAYNILHLDAMYDLLQHTYIDVMLVGDRNANEKRNLCTMVDRSLLNQALVIADRGYENYNLMAHIQEKDWKYLIRIKDPQSAISGIASGLDLPDSDEFDLFVDLSLTTKSSNSIKELLKDRNHYRFLPSKANFDYLPKKNRKHENAIFYSLPFRIVRFKITEDSYETVVTNLDELQFPPEELKKLYSMRWGVETSFRDLKYTIGLLHFHSKKLQFICQEIFARLVMYNFSALITVSITVPNKMTQYTYKINFSAAVSICRRLFSNDISTADAVILIEKFVIPIRPGRCRPRKASAKHPIVFTYRIA